MRKILLVIVLLVLAAPLFASDVTITVTPVGDPVGTLQKVNIGYTGAAVSPAANAISAFALSLTVDLTADANIANIRDFKVGESNATSKGYGIFPAKFRSYIQVQNSTTADWADTNYTPLAEWGDANAGWGNNTKWIVAELGTLYQGDANAPASSGTLFAIDVNVASGTDCNLCIALDQIRGGVVRKDANAATVTLPPGGSGAPPGCIKIGPQPCCSVEPNCIGLTRAQCCAALISLGYMCGVEANVAPTAAGQTVGMIIGQKPAPGTIIAPGTPTDINVVSYPIKAMAVLNSLYVNWVANGKPQCWAYPRQCHGDADGKKLGTLWVSGNDLIEMKRCIAKNPLPPGCSCCDFDHKKLGTLWVSGNDLNILKAYISKAEASVPMCGSVPIASKGFSTDPNYWYWCIPTGGTACPTGQYCAPIGVCPNTP